MQWDELNGQGLELSEDRDATKRWHSAKAVLLLLREELQQMRDFIDRLRVRQIPRCKSPHDLNDLGGAGGLDCGVQNGPSGLCSVDEALRVV